MPRKKEESREPFADLVVLIKGKDYNAHNLSFVLPHSRNTIQRRLRSPEELTLGDLLRISKDGVVTWAQMMKAIKDEGD